MFHARVLRHERWAWGVLALGLLVATVVVLPRMETRFAFRDLFSVGHPARDAYDAFEEAFDLGSRVVLHFHGPGVFGAPFLRDAEALGNRLRHLPGTRGVLSPLDLLEPKLSGNHQLLSRILREEVLADPARLAARLGREPFPDAWAGLLHDRPLTTWMMVVTPPRDDSDPRASRRWVEEVLRDARATARAHGVEVYPGGYRFLHHEVRRVGMESQLRLTLAAFALLIPLFWILFGRLVVGLQVIAILGLSVVFGYAAMAGLGLPLTFLSVNLAVMVVVIGTADLVHIAGSYATHRRLHDPTGAALRAARETALPVFLTSVTTSACLLVTAATPLDQLRTFSLSLAVGVMVTWVLAVVYGPLLLRRSGIEPHRGAYGGLVIGLQDLLRPVVESARVRAVLQGAFAVLTLAALVLVAGQRVDSNAFRYFGPNTPVARTLEFLGRRGLAVSQVDLTLPYAGTLRDALGSHELERDLERIEAAVRNQRGVLGVDHLFTLYRPMKRAIDLLEYPPEIAPEWHGPRRAALLRQHVALGSFDRYFSTRIRELRVVVRTELESTSDLTGLREAIVRDVAALDLAVLDPGGLVVTGQMHYWSAIVAELPRTFLRNVLGGLGIVGLFFLVLTRSPRLAAVALVPNVIPVLVMFGFGRLAGIPMNENLCFVVALAIGIAVDDTLHFLFHFRRARARGRSRPAAVRETLRVAGAPILVTSLLLVGGFALCLTSPVAPIWQMGVLLLLAIASALAADLVLLPALLLSGADR